MGFDLLFSHGVRIGRFLALLNPFWLSKTTSFAIIISDETGAPVKVFSGSHYLWDCEDWLRSRLAQKGIDFAIKGSLISVGNIHKVEKMLDELKEMEEA